MKGVALFILSGLIIIFPSCTPKKLSYKCTEGTTFSAVVNKKQATLFIQGKTFDLPRVYSHKDAKYSDGKITYETTGKTSFILDGDQMVDWGCVEEKGN